LYGGVYPAQRIAVRVKPGPVPGVVEIVQVPLQVRRELPSVHPAEVLLEESLKPLPLSQNRLALSIGVQPRRINEIVLGKRRVTAETALRLARYFGTTRGGDQDGFYMSDVRCKMAKL